jgi:hypothetical protein
MLSLVPRHGWLALALGSVMLIIVAAGGVGLHRRHRP